MIVIYRMCPQGNPIKERPFGMDKKQVVKAAYNSFIKTFKKSSVIFIIDKPEDWIEQMVSSCKLISTIKMTENIDWQSGNENTFRLQLEIARDCNDKVLLLEDDYLWVNRNSESIIENSIDELGFVSPYDHPNHYFELEYDIPRIIKVSGNHHWQSIISSTLTFATNSKLIDKNWEHLTGNGVVDDQMWKNIPNQLWSPIPSLAIHMETSYISPTFKWEQLWLK